MNNVNGHLHCVKKKPVDSWDCTSLYGVSGLGYSYNLCHSWVKGNIQIKKIVYIIHRQFQIEQSIKSCTEDSIAYLYYSNPCPPGFRCIGSVCVDMTKAHAQVMKFGIGPPNNVYFAFSLWDDHCRPIALPFSTL